MDKLKCIGLEQTPEGTIYSYEGKEDIFVPHQKDPLFNRIKPKLKSMEEGRIYRPSKCVFEEDQKKRFGLLNWGKKQCERTFSNPYSEHFINTPCILFSEKKTKRRKNK